MNFLTKIIPGKRIVEVYLKTLTDTSMYTGIHSWDFTGEWPNYKPQKSLVDFFIKSLGKIHSLGLNDEAIAKGLNSYNCHNLLCAEIALWTADDVSLILSALDDDEKLIYTLHISGQVGKRADSYKLKKRRETMEECNDFDQLNPTKNLRALEAISTKLCEVSKALQQCQTVTQKLSQALDLVAKRYAFLHAQGINRELETQQNEHHGK